MNTELIQEEINSLKFTQQIYEDIIIFQDGCPEEYEPKIEEIKQKIQVLKQELAKIATV